MALVPTTWNPLNKGASLTLSDGNFTATPGHYNSSVKSIFGASSGKWYWEVTLADYGSPSFAAIGVGTTAAPVSGDAAAPGGSINSWGYYAADGSKYNNASGAAYGFSLVAGDVVGVALDLDAGTLKFYKNGADLGVAFTGLSGTFYAMLGIMASASCRATANFGQTAFAYTPPTGYSAGFGYSASLTPTTWNPDDKSGTCTLTNGNLTAEGNQTGNVRSVFSASSGKWYWETTIDARYGGAMIGIATAAASLSRYPGFDANGWSFYGYPPGYKVNAAAETTYGAAFYIGDVVGVALDLDAGTLRFYVNGVDQGIAFSGLSGTFFAAFGGSSSGPTERITANFGGSLFTYVPPAGFTAGFGAIIPEYTYVLSGTVEDASGNPCERLVGVFKRSPFTLVETTYSNATTGAFSVTVPTNELHVAIAVPLPEESLNALVLDRIMPEVVAA